jgi:hypothetical protein
MMKKAEEVEELRGEVQYRQQLCNQSIDQVVNISSHLCSIFNHVSGRFNNVFLTPVFLPVIPRLLL